MAGDGSGRRAGAGSFPVRSARHPYARLMRAHTTIRFNVHLDSTGTPLSWALLRYHTDPRGVVRAELEDHGRVDMASADPDGLSAIAQLLLRAGARTP